jgi:hypothetical protein
LEVELAFKDNVPASEVRATMAKAGAKEAHIQALSGGEKDYLIRFDKDSFAALSGGAATPPATEVKADATGDNTAAQAAEAVENGARVQAWAFRVDDVLAARERFMAAGTGHELKQRLDAKPARFCLTDDILEAASDRWRDAFLTTHRETMGVFVGIVRDGVASGDLPRGTLPELVASATWALSVGMDQLHEGGLVFRGVPKEDFRNMRHKMFYALLDGFGWKPLSTELDYETVRRRILAEIYAPEARQLGLLPKASRATAAAAR